MKSCAGKGEAVVAQSVATNKRPKLEMDLNDSDVTTLTDCKRCLRILINMVPRQLTNDSFSSENDIGFIGQNNLQ